MRFFPKCAPSRNRYIALVLLGASFAIQMVPPILHRWAEVAHASDGSTMAAMVVIYLVLLGVALSRGRPQS